MKTDGKAENCLSPLQADSAHPAHPHTYTAGEAALSQGDSGFVGKVL